jgi:copper transport protein
VRRAAAPVLVVLVAFGLVPATAAAHAELEATVPARGAMVMTPPRDVEFRFDEPVEATLGAVHVFDAKGERVEDGGVFHPAGAGRRVAVKLPAGLPKGGYTATYRVISADSHPVSGGFSFTVGHEEAAVRSVDALLSGTGAGPVTSTALGVARGVQYAAIALAVGVLLFLALCWRPVAPAAAAQAALADRTRTLLIGAGVAGVVTAVAGVLLQGAVAQGSSLWSALKPSVAGDVLGTKFGTWWGLAALVWLAVLALARRPAWLALPLGLLCLLPSLSGHPSVESPTWLMWPSNVVHVVAISGWIGGLAVMVLALRTATATVPADERGPLLAATVGRFSAWAGVAVALVLATGIAQSLAAIDAWSELVHTAYGRSVAIKLGLFAILLGFGFVNRTRILPALRATTTPGRAGVLLRRSLRLELATAVVVLGVTGALATYPPADASNSGPVSVSAMIGPARMEATVDPARVGANEVHLYLFDRRSGAQWDQAKELTAMADLPSKGIEHLPVMLHRGGPGHFIGSGVAFGVAGDWRIHVAARVSDFDQFEQTLKVRIR